VKRLALRLLPALALAGLGATQALAETHRLEDPLSHTVPPTAQMEWLPQTPGDRDGGMESWVRVNIQIETRPWIGRAGRIYMVLPRDQASTIEAVWTANGPLRSGRLVSGERALVWAGTLTSDSLNDQIQVRLRSGPDWQSASRRLNFHFELDTD
jgi:hypothetical protein